MADDLSRTSITGIYAHNAPTKKSRLYRAELIKRAENRVAEFLFPKITTEVGGQKRLLDQPPLMFHRQRANFDANAKVEQSRITESLYLMIVES